VTQANNGTVSVSNQSQQYERAIGVFDSGVGGLTVLRALRAALPNERFIYLGDTARLPYGTKSRDSIVRYSLQAARALVARDIKCLVVACNTASAVALQPLRDAFAPLPVLGVVEPGAEAGCVASRSGRIAVIATDSTVRGGAYQSAIQRLRPDAVVISRACPLFVALAEEGWIDGDIAEGVAHRYLDDIFANSPQAARPDTLVLGCTHFPVLIEPIRAAVGKDIAIVDSAITTATVLRAELHRLSLDAAPMHRPTHRSNSVTLLATDGRERFARVGSVFLGEPLNADDIELVDLQP
jgi:glutamate racemase